TYNIPLQNNFVTTPPLLDSFGNSFAYLLSQYGKEPYNKKSWIEKNLQYFKISELKYTLSKFQITNKTFKIISKLKNTEINELINNSAIILTSNFVFIKKSQGNIFSKDNYLIFRLEDFNNNIKKSNFIVSSKKIESECLIIIGNTCWNYSAVQSYFYLRKFSSIILVLIGILFSVVLLIISKKIINKNREFYKNKLALQVLSHEFRTPISSLLLMIEKLNLNLSNFNIKEQDLITQISSEVFKLQRIVEVSKSYLQSESGNVKFNFVKIESINNWISDFVSEMNLNINSELLENDLSIKIDPFWLKFLLTNLIQNAFAHGKPPVFIRLKEANGKVKITIEDQGKCAFHSINEMTNAFVKSESSKGMGLGLNIVKYILSQCEGRIEFSSFPTTFSLILKH
ncbi:MAG: hypothetical protein KDK36_09615, partial [Leptospiraceae bacterium]|nr:hypothetical protein [Leptospiraceae bacterium]